VVRQAHHPVFDPEGSDPKGAKSKGGYVSFIRMNAYAS
jgi:hypothetical protein